MLKLTLPPIPHWSITFDLKLDFTFFSFSSGVRLNFSNITSEMTLALSSSDDGQIAPIITDMKFEAKEKTTEVENLFFLFRVTAEKIINVGQKISGLVASEFGIPIANAVLPKFTQMMVRNQVVRVPISVP
jgi:hypothetical protein